MEWVTYEQLGVLLYMMYFHEIKEVIYNPPRTIINWVDGSKTVVKCRPEDEYDYELGFLYCIAKRSFGDKFHSTMRKYCWENPKCIDCQPDVKTHSLEEFNKLLP